MSIRFLARRLYQAVSRVSELEERLEHSPPEERTRIETELWGARRDKERLMKTLKAKKD